MLRDVPPPRYALRSERLIASPVEPDDVAELHEAALASQPELYPFMPWCHAGLREREIADWADAVIAEWQSLQSCEFCLRSQDDGSVIGMCGINSMDLQNRGANLGYWIRTSACGSGYATEASRLICHFGFDSLELQRIEIVVATDNAGSLRVAEKLGAEKEGILRNRLYLRDRACDAWSFSLIPKSY